MSDQFRPSWMARSMLGFSLIVDESAVSRPWIFPKSPYFEYEPKDEQLCRKYGIGHEGPEQPAAYRVGDKFVVHPKIMEEMKKRCRA